MKKIVAVLLTSLLMSSFLFAQKAEPKKVYPDETVINIEDGVFIDGKIKKPSMGAQFVMTGIQFSNLFKLKKDFNSELKDSVELLD